MGRLTSALRSVVPAFVKPALARIIPSAVLEKHKHSAELQFWEQWARAKGCQPETEYYRKFMLDMGGLSDQKFFDGRICLDIGCGPRGSLSWLSNAKAALGLDPLADQYTRFGIERHSMIYLCAEAEHIPLPSRYVDVVFAMNSLDHVRDAVAACAEIRRVLKPGGHFIASLNLDEPVSLTEPWTLTEAFLQAQLFGGWEKQFYKIRPKLHDPAQFGPYKYFYEDCPKELSDKPGPRALWCRMAVPLQ